jgi:hypothetical protein
MIKKLKDGLSDLSWTIAGTALVLITLSGQTRTYGLWISGIALTVYFFGIIISSDDNE